LNPTTIGYHCASNNHHTPTNNCKFSEIYLFQMRFLLLFAVSPVRYILKTPQRRCRSTSMSTRRN
jgi:hypothetical protein